MKNITLDSFSNISLEDPFFDTLKNDYAEFSEWYKDKAKNNALAYILKIEGSVHAFLYLKIEDSLIDDISPLLEKKKRLKIGTFKIDAHGTKLGERFVKKIFDNATENAIDEIYVTIFERHASLIKLLKTFGFREYGIKKSNNGTEIVLLKVIGNIIGDILQDYPCVISNGKQKHVLSILPRYHSRLFPDSILDNESYSLLEDISYTNSIYKVYMAKMSGITDFKEGDNVLIYRTKDNKGPAYYRSVITSVCVVKEVKNINDFRNFNDFYMYVKSFTIFDNRELQNFFDTKQYPYIIKMTYNIAFTKRVTNGQLVDMGISPDYWGVFKLSDENFYKILRVGEVNESLIIN